MQALNFGNLVSTTHLWMGCSKHGKEPLVNHCLQHQHNVARMCYNMTGVCVSYTQLYSQSIVLLLL